MVSRVFLKPSGAEIVVVPEEVSSEVLVSAVTVIILVGCVKVVVVGTVLIEVNVL